MVGKSSGTANTSLNFGKKSRILISDKFYEKLQNFMEFA